MLHDLYTDVLLSFCLPGVFVLDFIFLKTVWFLSQPGTLVSFVTFRHLICCWSLLSLVCLIRLYMLLSCHYVNVFFVTNRVFKLVYMAIKSWFDLIWWSFGRSDLDFFLFEAWRHHANMMYYLSMVVRITLCSWNI